MSDYSPAPDGDAHDRSPGSPDIEERHIHDIAEAEAAITAEDVAEDVARDVTRRRLRPLEALMLTMLAISLLVHALTISRLLSVRNTLREEIGRLADGVQAAKSNQVRYTLPVDQQIPIDVDVPIRRSLSVPIQTEVRINQQINLPIDTGFGNVNIPVPIDANVPISTTVPIEFDQTINISTSVPLKLNVPIQVDLGADPFSGYLDKLHQDLLDLRDKF